MSGAPSLKGLQAFEAAARVGGYASAADELGVSAAAVGQLVRSLEDQTGRKLFRRVGRGVELTEAGRELLPRLSSAFEELRGVSRELSGAGPRPRIIVSAPPSVAAGWMPARIAGFAAVHGAYDISVRADAGPVAFERDLIDIRLSYGPMPRSGDESERIAVDAVYPVCSPRFAEEAGVGRDPASLLRGPLIHTDWGSDAAAFPPWRAWFEAADVPAGPRMDRGPVADGSLTAVELARYGLGIALAQGMLASEALEKRQLIRPAAGALPLARAYFLTCPSRSLHRPIVAALRRWLADGVRQAVEAARAAEPD